MVPLRLLEALLAGVACGAVDEHTSELWITADGRYRLGAVIGAWNKSKAVYIGHTARVQARERRLQEIDQLLQQLDEELVILATEFALLAEERLQTKSELDSAPSDAPFLTALLAIKSAEQAVTQARARHDAADAHYRVTEDEFQAERRQLEGGAVDLQLPMTPDGLPPIESALDGFTEARHGADSCGRQYRRIWP